MEHETRNGNLHGKFIHYCSPSLIPLPHFLGCGTICILSGDAQGLFLALCYGSFPVDTWETMGCQVLNLSHPCAKPSVLVAILSVVSSMDLLAKKKKLYCKYCYNIREQ